MLFSWTSEPRVLLGNVAVIQQRLKNALSSLVVRSFSWVVADVKENDLGLTHRKCSDNQILA